MGLLQSFLERGERAYAVAVELADPAVVEGVDGRGIEKVQLLAAAPEGDDEVRHLEEREVLGHRLAGHRQLLAQLGERLAGVGVQPIEERAARRVGERFPDDVRIHVAIYATKRLPMSSGNQGAKGARQPLPSTST